jgi:hypothetical protein
MTGIRYSILATLLLLGFQNTLHASGFALITPTPAPQLVPTMPRQYFLILPG